MKKKLKSRGGETLTETLVALLIGVMGLVMLPGAIVTSARVNAEAQAQTDILFSSLDESGAAAADTVTFYDVGTPGGVDTTEWTNQLRQITVSVYQDDAGLKYYR